MNTFWKNYWPTFLSALTILLICTLSTGIWMGFKVWQEVKKIDSIIEEYEDTRKRLNRHEVAMIQLASEVDYPTRELIEIMRGSPYRGQSMMKND